MEITTRQFERLLTCSILLEEACEKNNVALRAVRLIREQLDEIEAEGEAWDEVDLVDGVDTVDAADDPAQIRAYGQEVMAGGCGLKHLIGLTMEHFGLTQTAFANLIGVNQGSLSHYLNCGERREAVLKAVTEFFGFDGGANRGQGGRRGRRGQGAGSKAEGK